MFPMTRYRSASYTVYAVCEPMYIINHITNTQLFDTVINFMYTNGNGIPCYLFVLVNIN